ncbi:histone-lysine N-methyltransferase SETD1B-A [Trichomycterus rosablanca]|uniref:histone-lysine N-methyltransferase SETD1B-A n=1 Tax=Trichomycterus rosablanca TaxID=2290929 RepID=UPI002F35F541
MCESVQREEQEDNEDRAPIWSSYKLIVDPVLNGGKEKLYRYDGLHFSVPNADVFPPEVKDPRFARIWIKFKETDLPVPKFKIDENYVGPPKEVTFARLNDNIKSGFLMDMCRKFGEVQHLEVLYNPVNKKHLGLAKVIFESVRATNEVVQKLHNTSVMGITIHVELDPKGEKRTRYFQLLVSGLYTPFTFPLGDEAWRPQSPSYTSDSLTEDELVKRLTHGLLSSSLSSSSFLLGSTPFDVSTPMSMDTAYSSMHQDTPSSFCQDTPHSSPVSFVSHSNPGTPPQCRGNETDTHIHTDTPGLKTQSDSQPLYRNPHLVQLTPHTPNTRPGAQNVSTSQSHQTGRTPRGRHRGQVWGAKYQNAYNRRPEHRYVHRPGFNSSHYRSGNNLVPLGPAAAQTQMDISSKKRTEALGQKVTPFISKALNTPSRPSTGIKVKEPITPVSPRVSTHHKQTYRKIVDNAVHIKPSRTSYNSPPHVPMDTSVTQTPKQCSSPGPEKSPLIAAPSPDPVPSSLDSRIKMLLGSPDPFPNGEILDSEGRVSPDIPPSSEPLDVSASLNCSSSQFSSTLNQQASPGSGIEDVSPFPLPDSAEEQEESESDNKGPSRIPVISNMCLTTRSAHPSYHTPTLFLQEGETLVHPTDPEPHSESAAPVFQMPPPPVLLPPPGFLPPNLPLCGPPPSLLPPVPSLLNSSSSNPSVPPSLFYLPPKVPVSNVNRPSRFPSPPAPLPIPTRITQGKSQPVYPTPFPILAPPTPLPYQAFPSWPPPPVPVFDSSVPPPGYVPVSASLHKATVDGVMAAVAVELRAIVKKDIHRRMIEVVAFGEFDQWWNENERTAKISTGHPQPVDSKEKEFVKPRDLDQWKTVESVGADGTTLGTGLSVGLRSALKLPSFKVKRKDPSSEDSVKTKRLCPLSPGQRLSAETEAEQQTYTEEEAVNEPKTDHEVSVVKRRHARPLELDSDEEKEEEGKEEEQNLRKWDNSGPENEDMKERELSNNDQDKSDKNEEWTSADRQDESHSDQEVISTASPESLSFIEVDSSSTVSPTSDLSSSYESRYSSEYSSDSASTFEEDDEDEGESLSSEAAEEQTAPEEIWISSDEEGENEQIISSPAGFSVNSWEDELDPPLTPSAPFFNAEDLDEDLLSLPRDPGQEEELRVRVFLHSYGCQDPVKQHLSNKLDLTDPALLSTRELELQYPPSPSYRASSSDEGLETQSETELEDPIYRPDLLEDSGNLRPPTPTGSQSDSDPELELGHRLSLPASEEEERPPTPGGGFETEMETPVLSPARASPLPPPPSPTGAHDYPSPPLYLFPPLLPLYPAYEETPKTPGRNKEELHHSVGLKSSLRMAMHSPFSPSFLSVSPHAGNGIPRTPGRDVNPMSPLSEESEVNFNQRESLRQRGRWQQHSHPYWVHSASSSPHSSDSSGSETSNSFHPRQQPSLSSNQLERLDVLQLRKKRERLQHKRRMMFMHQNKHKTDTSDVPLSRELQRIDVQAKKPLQGLENRLDNQLETELHQKALGHRKALYSYRNRTSCPRQFTPRSKRRERLLINAVWTKGVNMEEIGHLKASYERMLQQDDAHDWLTSTHWVPHPHSSSPSSAPVEWPTKSNCIRYHLTGCARTEGYYIISKRDKLQYLQDSHTVSEEETTDTRCKNTQTQFSSSSRSGSDFRAEQRRLLSSFSCDSDLLKFNQLKYRKKKLRFSRSRIHEWGLFAEEPIAADEMVIEYVGESIRQVIADMRERRYEQEGIGSSYLFRVDLDTIIDATKCGNLARFINHSCNPNCYAKVITVEAKKKIVIYSRQPIGVNEEIMYDYKFPIEDEKIPCLCGAENCKGTLN